MVKVNINVGVEMPDKMKPEYEQCSLLDKVRDYIFVCESDQDSEYHYDYLRCLYKKLKECEERLKPDKLVVLKILDDWFRSLPNVASDEDAVDLEGKDMFKYSDGR